MEAAIQTLVVALLVPVCTGYAAWKLLPGSGRRALAGGLVRLPGLPAMARRWAEGMLRTSATGCGCDVCDRRAPAAAAAGMPSAPKPIVLHRRQPASKPATRPS